MIHKFKDFFVELDNLENSKLKNILQSRVFRDRFNFRHGDNHTDYDKREYADRYSEYSEYSAHEDHNDSHYDHYGRHTDRYETIGAPGNPNFQTEHNDFSPHSDEHTDVRQ